MVSYGVTQARITCNLGREPTPVPPELHGMGFPKEEGLSATKEEEDIQGRPPTLLSMGTESCGRVAFEGFLQKILPAGGEKGWGATERKGDGGGGGAKIAPRKRRSMHP